MFCESHGWEFPSAGKSMVVEFGSFGGWSEADGWKHVPKLSCTQCANMIVVLLLVFFSGVRAAWPERVAAKNVVSYHPRDYLDSMSTAGPVVAAGCRLSRSQKCSQWVVKRSGSGELIPDFLTTQSTTVGGECGSIRFGFCGGVWIASGSGGA